ncbi:unnamed protein product [Arabis nemorensis]|uniref:Uncharacterized protein n=1 Tax=Arabis nemorensis TaxID=586526 RepID=A0A565AMN6_9BRAS|nr:unnamed protein product [Arabis nemorensis]
MSEEFKYDVETMFGRIPPPPQNIKSAHVNNGYDGSLEIKLYGQKETSSNELLLDAGLTFVPKAPEGSLARVMLLDILAWALDHPPSYRS